MCNKFSVCGKCVAKSVWCLILDFIVNLLSILGTSLHYTIFFCKAGVYKKIIYKRAREWRKRGWNHEWTLWLLLFTYLFVLRKYFGKINKTSPTSVQNFAYLLPIYDLLYLLWYRICTVCNFKVSFKNWFRYFVSITMLRNKIIVLIIASL